MELRKGCQEPGFERIGNYHSSDGEDAIALFGHYGYAFMPSQMYQLTLLLAKDEYGMPAITTIGLTEPRQNGKSFVARSFAAWKAAVEGKRVLYSAHNGRTSNKMFKELCFLFESDPDWEKMLLPTTGIYRQPGREGIYLKNGGKIEFSTRTKGSTRGESYSVLIIDEAQEMTDEHAEALLPTASAAGDSRSLEVTDPLIVYLGTPHYPACAGTIFRRMHHEAHQKEPPSFWWLEWGIQSIHEKDKITKDEVEDLIYQTNPGLGYRLSFRAVENELSSMSWDSFCRERLGWWMPYQECADLAIPTEVWKGATIDEIGTKYDVKSTFGIKFSPDGSRYVLAGCKQNEEGDAACELIEVGSTAHGTRDLARQLCKRAGCVAAVAIDGLAGAEALCDNICEIKEQKPPKSYVLRPKAFDVVSAAQGLLDALHTGKLKHTKQPALDESALGCVKRRIGKNGGWGFGSGKTADSCPIEACALAFWAMRKAKRDPKRRQKIL